MANIGGASQWEKIRGKVDDMLVELPMEKRRGQDKKSTGVIQVLKEWLCNKERRKHWKSP